MRMWLEVILARATPAARNFSCRFIVGVVLSFFAAFPSCVSAYSPVDPPLPTSDSSSSALSGHEKPSVSMAHVCNEVVHLLLNVKDHQ